MPVGSVNVYGLVLLGYCYKVIFVCFMNTSALFQLIFLQEEIEIHAETAKNFWRVGQYSW